MWILLRAELQSLLNTFKTREGRQALLGFVILAACLAMAAVAIGGRTLMADEVVRGMREDPAFPVRGVVLLTLCGPIFIALGFVFATSKKELFANSRADLLLVSPVPRLAIAGRVFARLMFSAFVLQTVMTLPFLLGLVYEAGFSSLLLAMYPLSGLSLLAVFMALTMLIQTVLARYFSGPVLRFCAEALGVTLMLGVTALFFFGITVDPEQAALFVRMADDLARLPSPTDWPVDTLRDAAYGRVSPQAIGCVAMLATPLPVLAIVGAMYGRCRENRLVAHRPVVHRLRAPGRSWPSTAWASITRKDFVDLIRNRGGMFALVVLTCIQLMMLRWFASPVSEHSPLSPALQQGFGLIIAWQLLMMLLGPILALSIAAAEGPNLTLLATSPITPGTLLRGKSTALLFPMLWSILVALVAAPWIAGITQNALLIFLVGALPLVAVYFAVAAAVGAVPALFHRKDDQPLAESLTAIGPVLVVSGFLFGTMMLTYWLKSAVGRSAADQGPFGGMGPNVMWATILGVAWLGAGVLSWIGICLAQRNLAVVLGPRPD